MQRSFYWKWPGRIIGFHRNQQGITEVRKKFSNFHLVWLFTTSLQALVTAGHRQWLGSIVCAYLLGPSMLLFPPFFRRPPQVRFFRPPPHSVLFWKALSSDVLPYAQPDSIRSISVHCGGTQLGPVHVSSYYTLLVDHTDHSLCRGARLQWFHHECRHRYWPLFSNHDDRCQRIRPCRWSLRGGD